MLSPMSINDSEWELAGFMLTNRKLADRGHAHRLPIGDIGNDTGDCLTNFPKYEGSLSQQIPACNSMTMYRVSNTKPSGNVY